MVAHAFRVYFVRFDHKKGVKSVKINFLEFRNKLEFIQTHKHA